MTILNNVDAGRRAQVIREAVIERLADERCPAVDALSPPVNLNTSLEVR